MKNCKLPQRMVELGTARSAIRELFEYANRRKAEIGADKVFDFSLGNPSTPPPERVSETLLDLLQNKDSIALHGYTSSIGSPEARRACAALECARGGNVPSENIYMTCGAAASLTITLSALINEGERVILLAPYFPEYRVFAEKAGASVAVVPPAPDTMLPDLARLECELAKGAKAVIINSPNNPSGAVFDEQTLSKIGELLKKCDERVFLIADEPYRELLYDGVKAPYIPDFYEDTIICYSFSKSLSLPGERIGYIAVPPCLENDKEVVAAIGGAGRALGYVCAPSLFQQLVSLCADCKPSLESYEKNRELIYASLTKMGFECIRPEGAFYLFIKCPAGLSAEDFCEKAKARELLLVPSTSFGVDGYARLSYCVAYDTILRSLDAFEALADEVL